MKIKINRNSDVPKWLSIVTLFFAFREALFYTIPFLISSYPYTVTYYNKKDLCILIFAAFLIIAIKRGGNLRVSKDGFTLIAIFFILMVLISYIISVFAYPDEKISTLFNKYYFYLAIFLFFVLKYFLKKYPGYYEVMLKTIIIVGAGYAVFMIYSKIVYIKDGSYVFDAMVQYIQKRSGGLRLARAADYISFASVISFSVATKERIKKKRIYYLCLTIIMFIAIVFVTKTRIYELAIIVACVFGYLCNEKNKNKKIWMLAAISCAGLMMLPVILTFFGTFTRAEDIGGTLLRFSAYDYYLKHMFTNGVIGLGFTSLANYDSILSGPYLTYNMSDAGYIGFIGAFGISGVIFLVLLLRKLYTNWIKVDCKQFTENKILIIYLLITSISVIFNDPQRSMLLPICLTIFEYTYMTTVEKEKIQINEVL